MRSKPTPARVTARLLAFSLASLSAMAAAEPLASGGGEIKDAPIYIGGELAVGSPLGEFDKNVDTSVGVGVHVGYRLASFLSIRFDIAHLIYGSDSWRTTNPSFPGVSFEMNTENTLTFFGLGPQLTGRLGPLRPFVNLSGGFETLSTSTTLRGNGQEMNVAEDTNFRDYAWAWGGGAGVHVPIPAWKGVTVSLGAFYQAGGNAEYVLKGGLRRNGDGTVSPETVESKTGLVRYQLGLTMGM